MLGARVAVGDDPGAGLQQRDAVVQDDRPDRDARVERAAGQRVEDRAGVGAAAVLLELRDDLHRAHLRRARDGARREGRAQQVERRDAGRELADDLRDEVRDVREPLRLEEPLDLHRPGQADAREVVAAEVDEHHVLGAVLLRGEQPLRVAVARARRAGDRVHRRARAVEPDERLRRRADEGDAVELEQEEVRRRVDAAQRPVDRERRGAGAPLRPLREDDLERVAGADVLLAALDAPLVVGLARRTPGRAAGPAPAPAGSGGTAPSSSAVDLGRVAREHLGDRAAVVEADEHVGDDEPALGQPAAVVRQRHGRLELRDVVVAEVADDRLVERLRPPRSVTRRSPLPTSE